MPDEVTLLTAEEIAAMQSDVERLHAGLDFADLGPVRLHPDERWCVKRIVHTLETLMRERGEREREHEALLQHIRAIDSGPWPIQMEATDAE